ncbi:hypothetical protein G6O45_24695, partial [Salmonella enterica subsp. enterica serovar Istanbul]|nr:hypothetical protein [Salmonella enterica subsp. enterica serovar Istanbul]
RWLMLPVLVAGLAGCPKSGSKEEGKTKPPKTEEKADASAHSDEPEHEELPKRVRLTKEVIADAKIQTAPVIKEILAVTLA